MLPLWIGVPGDHPVCGWEPNSIIVVYTEPSRFARVKKYRDLTVMVRVRVPHQAYEGLKV